MAGPVRQNLADDVADQLTWAGEHIRTWGVGGGYADEELFRTFSKIHNLLTHFAAWMQSSDDINEALAAFGEKHDGSADVPAS